MNKLSITLTVNGKEVTEEIEPRILLSDFLRDTLKLTGTHIGCEHGVCGVCTVHLNGESVRSCLTFAAQADGCEIQTVESLEKEGGQLHPLQQAFTDNHAMQCGFCTPGFLMSLEEFLRKNPNPNDKEIKEACSSTLCRCTGYANILKAVRQASQMISN